MMTEFQTSITLGVPAIAGIIGRLTTTYVTPQELRLVHHAAQAARCTGGVHAGRVPVPGSRGSQCVKFDSSEA